MNLRDRYIVIISNEPWGDVWFSKHHYANELSKLGNEVYFVNPVNNWRFTNLFSCSAKMEQVQKKLFVINYKNNFPIRVLPDFFLKLNDILNFRKIKKYLHNQTSIILWQFDAFRFVNPIKCKQLTRIYHVIDPYMHLPNDSKLAHLANLIICTNTNYLPYYAKYKSVIHIPHGVSLEEKFLDQVKVNDIKKKYGNFVFLAGSITNSINFNLLIEVAKKLSSKLIIAGSVRLKDTTNINLWNELVALKNVEYIGMVSYRDLKNWIAVSSVCLVVYLFDMKHINKEPLTPLKSLDYLLQYKPVITSTPLQIEELEGKAVYTTTNKEEFIACVERIEIGNLYVDESAVTFFLEERNYKNLLSQIEGQLNEK